MAARKVDDQVHADLYNKINACTAAITGLTKEIRTFKADVAKETERYVELVRNAQERQFRVSGCLFLLAVFCVGIIGYGAIGQKGMYTVRNTMPTEYSGVIDNPYMLPSDRDNIVRPEASSDGSGRK